MAETLNAAQMDGVEIKAARRVMLKKGERLDERKGLANMS
jgi:hypothetical protein